VGGIQGSHYLDLVEQGQSVTAVLGQHCCLLRKCLGGEVLAVGEALDLVDCCEPALAQLLHRFE
jgi:hypothetical protein